MDLLTVVKPQARLCNESFTETADEALHGWRLGVTEETPEGFRVLTHYGYEAYIRKEDAVRAEAPALPALTVKAAWADVLSAPRVQAGIIAALPRGSFLYADGPAENGYAPVVTADGRRGFVPEIAVMPRPDSDGFFAAENREDYFLRQARPQMPEAAFRTAVANAARLYLGAPYRWGGKSPAGIDCSGLVFMAYMLSGVLIHRDSGNHPAYPVRKIPKEQIRKGDLMYFPGHVALYLGGGEYIHSTAYRYSFDCCINSLDPKSPLYRPDMVELVRGGGTLF